MPTEVTKEQVDALALTAYTLRSIAKKTEEERKEASDSTITLMKQAGVTHTEVETDDVEVKVTLVQPTSVVTDWAAVKKKVGAKTWATWQTPQLDKEKVDQAIAADPRIGLIVAEASEVTDGTASLRFTERAKQVTKKLRKVVRR